MRFLGKDCNWLELFLKSTLAGLNWEGNIIINKLCFTLQQLMVPDYQYIQQIHVNVFAIVYSINWSCFYFLASDFYLVNSRLLHQRLSFQTQQYHITVVYHIASKLHLQAMYFIILIVEWVQTIQLQWSLITTLSFTFIYCLLLYIFKFRIVSKLCFNAIYVNNIEGTCSMGPNYQ